MTITITAYTDLRSPYTFVAKAEVYRWEEDFGVAVDWWPYTTPLEEAFGGVAPFQWTVKGLGFMQLPGSSSRRRWGIADPGLGDDDAGYTIPR